jgi:hypothetical protein
MAVDLSTEAGLAGNYPSQRFNPRERKLAESVKEYVDNLEVASSGDTDGSNKPLKLAIVTYDVAEHGDPASVGLGVTIPDNSLIVHVAFNTETDFDSTSGTTTLTLGLPTDGNLTAAITANAYSTTNGSGTVDFYTPGNTILTTAAREVTATISNTDVLTGVIKFYIYYV